MITTRMRMDVVFYASGLLSGTGTTFDPDNNSSCANIVTYRTATQPNNTISRPSLKCRAGASLH